MRVGVLLDTLVVPAWVDLMLTRIEESASAKIVLLVLRRDPPGPHGGPANAGTPLRRRLLRLLQGQGGSALEPRSLAERYAGIACIRASVERGAPDDHLARQDADALREYGLDVLLGIDFGLAPGATEPVARYGTWQLTDRTGRPLRESSSGFWEVIRREPTTSACLRVQTDNPATAVMVATTRTPTHPSSIALNRETLLWGALSLVPRQLERLARTGNEAINRAGPQPADPPAPLAQDAVPPCSLSTPRLAACLLRLFTRRLRRSIRFRLFEEQWHLRYAFGDLPARNFARFAALHPPRDRYWADPMPLFHDGQWHIFFEDFRQAGGLGRISVISFDRNHEPQSPRDALVRPYHLSYPFVFHWDDRLWMIPETASTRAVELYECVDFPDQWQLRRRFLENRYIVDATLERHGDAWYLFANEAENPGASSWTETFLYVNEGDLLNGSWKPHPQNPIRSDVTCARPAGPLFQARETLFRPAQDCSLRYGGAMAIHEITELSPGGYAEQIVDRIHPDWEPGLQGTHTFAYRPGLTVIDVMQEVPRPGILNRLPEPARRSLLRLLDAQPRTGSLGRDDEH